MWDSYDVIVIYKFVMLKALLWALTFGNILNLSTDLDSKYVKTYISEIFNEDNFFITKYLLLE